MRSLVTRYRPSPAMVVACTALTIALGGTGYAALRLPRNSVGTKQLRNGSVSNRKLARGAVTGSKVARNSLTGTQINEATLGLVPKASSAVSASHAVSADIATNATAAANATNATTAQDLAAPSDFHTVGATGEPAFQHSWQNSTSTLDYPLGFYKDREGVVHLRGRIIDGMPNNTIFQLPPGYRPPSGKYVTAPAACECNTAQTTIIVVEGSGFAPTADGSVTMLNGSLATGNSLWLDGISFLAES